MLCYLIGGVKLFVGAVKVIGPSSDTRKIWQDGDFPVRLSAEPIIDLDPQFGVSADDLVRRLGLNQGSPMKIATDDGQFVLDLLKQAKEKPVARSVDPKKLAKRYFPVKRKTKGKPTTQLVYIPEREPEETTLIEALGPARPVETVGTDEGRTQHVQVQHALSKIGADMGLDIWIPRHDRGKSWNGIILGDMPRGIQELPTKFDEATTNAVEQIDILWLHGRAIISAFEIECTTAVYSGLLRMGDLVALQPNINIKLFIVAPTARRDKVLKEIDRPIFHLLPTPLAKICAYLPIETLLKKIDGVHAAGVATSLKPSFLDDLAEWSRPNA